MAPQSVADIPAGYEVAVIVPCHNEEAAIGTVVADLRTALPSATIYVYDNASTDRTTEIAREAGAVVRHEPLKGKGNVVRRALADIDVDVYVLIDGDDTYDAAALPGLVNMLISGPYDQVTGIRRPDQEGAFRAGHEAGNRFFNRVVGGIFRQPVSDMLSGYRVFSRRFVRSFPAASKEFEIETELTIHAINNRVPQCEVPIGFKSRPDGSESKLNTYRDGLRILRTIARLLHHERPFAVWAGVAAILLAAGLLIGVPVVLDFRSTGTVAKLPSAVLAASLITLAVLGLVMAFLLESVRKLRQEQTRIAYLQHPSVMDRFEHSRGGAMTHRYLADALPPIDPTAAGTAPVERPAAGSAQAARPASGVHGSTGDGAPEDPALGPITA